MNKIQNNPVVVRFPPSPSGYLHIGGARTALFNWLLAKKYNGKFILRIEDTDKERSTIESVRMILDDLKWLELNWDEGPDIGGLHSPYFQSQRQDIYCHYAKKLVDEGKAYYCFCTEEELKLEKTNPDDANSQFKYNRKCLNLTESEKIKFINSGRPCAIRFKVPDNEEIIIEDIVKGKVVFNSEVLSDFIILKSDGGAVYNFAVVVDDALMGITHILRGDDHLSNTPKQILLYKALGFKIPVLGHVSMILGADGQKLSKRHCATAISEYRRQGFLREAVLNYLALLGWSPPDNKELLSIDELIKYFSIEKLAKNPAIFDFTKFKWLNSQHIKKLNRDQYFEKARPFIDKKYFDLFDEKKLKLMALSVRNYIDKFDEINEHLFIYVDESFAISDEAKEYLQKYDFKKLSKIFLEILNEFKILEGKSVYDFAKKIQLAFGQTGKEFYMLLRILVTGKTKGPELNHLLELIPVESLIKRVSYFINCV